MAFRGDEDWVTYFKIPFWILAGGVCLSALLRCSSVLVLSVPLEEAHELPQPHADLQPEGTIHCLQPSGGCCE